MNRNRSDANGITAARSRRRIVPLALLAAGLIGAGMLAGPVSGGLRPAFAAEQGARAMATRPDSFADLVEKVKPAVVSIQVKRESRFRGTSMDGRPLMRGLPKFPEGHPLHDFFDRFGRGMPEGRGPRFRGPRGRALGSGFIVSPDGYVVTNNHVVDGGERIKVVLWDGSSHDARLIGIDDKTDLALLKIEDGRKKFAYVGFADEAARVGDWVVAVGNPFGLGGTVTAGIVSARGREIGAGPYDDFLQIDAPINRGNSGGPAFNLKGEVVGVNTAIYSPSGGSVGIGFAIPASLARDVVADLKDDGRVSRGWLGVQIQRVGEDIAESLGLDEAHGAIVADVTPDSPAERAGVRRGDAILEVDGKSVDSPRDLARKIASIEPGKRADLTVLRDGRELRKTVTIGRLAKADGRAAPSPRGGREDESPHLGLWLEPAGEAEGVVVAGVDPDGPAADKGIRAGDVILEVNGEPVSSPRQVSAAAKAATRTGRKSVLLLLRSQRTNRFVAVPLMRG